MFTNDLPQRSILNSSSKKVGAPGGKKKKLNQIVHLSKDSMEPAQGVSMKSEP